MIAALLQPSTWKSALPASAAASACTCRWRLCTNQLEMSSAKDANTTSNGNMTVTMMSVAPASDRTSSRLRTPQQLLLKSTLSGVACCSRRMVAEPCMVIAPKSEPESISSTSPRTSGKSYV